MLLLYQGDRCAITTWYINEVGTSRVLHGSKMFNGSYTSILKELHLAYHQAEEEGQ